MPFVPSQVSTNVLVAVSGPVVASPLVARAPVHDPLAVQLLTLLEDHASVAEPPLSIEPGLALIDTEGAAGAGLPLPSVSL